MKKLILGLTVALMVLAGCSKDDDDFNDVTHQPVAKAILGKWYYAAYSINDSGKIPYPPDDCENFDDYQEYLATGILKFVTYDIVCDAAENNSDTYVIDGDILTVNGTTQFRIQSLTSQQLVLQRDVVTPDGTENTVTYFSRTRP